MWPMARRYAGKGGARFPGRSRGRRSKLTWSVIFQREFDSEGECIRAEYLHALERDGKISGLRLQPRIILGFSPNVTWTLDYFYVEDGASVFEDYKGASMRRGAGGVNVRMERETRIKLSWARSMGFTIRISVCIDGVYSYQFVPYAKLASARHGLYGKFALA